MFYLFYLSARTRIVGSLGQLDSAFVNLLAPTCERKLNFIASYFSLVILLAVVVQIMVKGIENSTRILSTRRYIWLGLDNLQPVRIGCQMLIPINIGKY